MLWARNLCPHAVEPEARLVRVIPIAELRCSEVARVLPVRDPGAQDDFLGVHVNDVQTLCGAGLRHVGDGQPPRMEAMLSRAAHRRGDHGAAERGREGEIVGWIAGRAGGYRSRNRVGRVGKCKHRPRSGQEEELSFWYLPSFLLLLLLFLRLLRVPGAIDVRPRRRMRSEEHTSEL